MTSVETAFVELPFKDAIHHYDKNVLGKNVAINKKVEYAKKRSCRKRNRSDMSPEELKRLRERERKAQQSRRDRIRAQKKIVNGWHNDDAAWEAFLNQSEAKKKAKTSEIPTMVSDQIEYRDEADGDEDEGNRDFVKSTPDGPPPLINGYLKEQVINPKIERNGSFYKSELNIEKKMLRDIDSNSSTGSHHSELNTGNQLNESVAYSSDENSSLGEKDGNKKLSHRYFLPSDELEKLRKRERDAKRKQREKQRLAKGREDQNGSLDCINPASNDSKHEEKIELKENNCNGTQSPSYKLSPHSSPEEKYTSPNENGFVAPFRTRISSPDGHRLSSSFYPLRDNYHISTSRHFISRNYSDAQYSYHNEDHTTQDDSRLYHSTHYGTLNSPEKYHNDEKNALEATAEKKRMISRNVDRKKLSEEELEDLRRRERDYQRERRARIRMEKAKSQVNHDAYDNKNSLAQYYLSPRFYHSHSTNTSDETLHQANARKDKSYSGSTKNENIHEVIEDANKSFDERYIRTHSPFDCHLNGYDKHFKENQMSDRRFDENRLNGNILAAELSAEHIKKKNDTNGEAGLLQVVPKARDNEFIKRNDSHAYKLPPNINGTNFMSNAKKSLLEDICSTLNKESFKQLQNNEDDDRLIIVQPNIESSSPFIDFHEQFAKEVKREVLNESFRNSPPHDISAVVDQLERRRRSNREAQRRRRARLKMQGIPDEQNQSPPQKDKQLDSTDIRGCRVKITPRVDWHEQSGYSLKQEYRYETLPHYNHDIRHDYHFHYPTHNAHRHQYYHEPAYISDEYSRNRICYENNVKCLKDKMISRFLTSRDHIEAPRSPPRIKKDTPPSPLRIKKEEIESLGKNSRKRKQIVPRKVILSSDNSTEEDIDICSVDNSSSNF
ncbi:uncharacterized protein LOC100214406 isoform X1 [Hydra vulgaris]|uniref:uncharacterized protein LOC100214406 isoform X1 n=2 Tax=Hydra vulgaris TaxID=6087 RepID=UPI0006415F7F|nr:uncharacterized protein LOC100214406 isoform X1 [Hydra vulgaris]XP_047126020.1 uncharacterized protein LOC100214406 isoform X1 [Hydra vulgaris]